LRFFAALAVFLRHSWMLKQSAHLRAAYAHGFTEGYAGVSFFFVLSGFILAYTYRERLRRLDRRTIETFLVARFARVYPVHVVTFVAAAILFARPHIGHVGVTVAAVQNLLLLQAFSPTRAADAFNTPSWSLSAEMFFYVLFPVLLVLTIRARRVLGGGRLVAATAAVVAGWTAFVWDAGSRVPSDIGQWFFYFNPLARVVDFGVGVVLAVTFCSLARGGYQPRGRRSVALFTAAELAAVGVLAGLVAGFEHVPQAMRWSVYYMPAMALVVFVFAFEGGLLGKALALRPLMVLGEVSFAFYMWHQLVMRLAGQHASLVAHPEATTAGVLVVSLAISFATWLVLERPARRIIRSAHARWRPAPRTASGTGTGAQRPTGVAGAAARSRRVSEPALGVGAPIAAARAAALDAVSHARPRNGRSPATRTFPLAGTHARVRVGSAHVTRRAVLRDPRRPRP
jgi:peptidoglycan/LPS O-acetylase OafA/YrhL